jgi:hypothetical protein
VDATIGEAFPTLATESRFAALLEQRGLTPGDPISDLLALGHVTPVVFESIAEVLLELRPGAPLGASAPGLCTADDEVLSFDILKMRSRNVLRRGGFRTWGDLRRQTPEDLLRLQSLGRKSAIEIVAVSLQRAATLEPRASGGVTEALHPDVAASDGSVRAFESAGSCLDGLDVLARWAACVGDARELGQALDLMQELTLPDEVARAVAELRAVPLAGLRGPAFGVEAAYEALLAAGGGQRHLEVLQRRLSFEPPTLDELGREFHVTRERIRQIQKATEEKLAAAAARPECAEIRWRALELRRRLGSGIPLKGSTADEALAGACRGIPQPHVPTARTILLWLAGPYRLDRRTGWLHTGPSTEIGPPPTPSLFHELVDEDDRIDLDALRGRAAAVGFVPDAIDSWVRDHCPIRVIQGIAFWWHGSVADKAATVLAVLGRPAECEELNRVIGEGHSPRGLRNRLLDDERFVRTDRVRVGLRRWGLEEYTGIVDEIGEEIEHRGGESDLEDLVRTVTERFSLKASSVANYTTVPRFVVEAGRIRLRRPDEPFIPERTLAEEAGCYLLGEDCCTYRIRIDADVLRGSGRPLPQGLGAWLGVLPGARRQFRFPSGSTVLVSWPDSALMGPALGSIRSEVLANGGSEGDHVLLEFDRAGDEVVATIVKPLQLETAEGWRRLGLLTGIQADDEGEVEGLLARAVGAATRADLPRRLHERGEDELRNLISLSASSELDDALEHIRTLLS